MHLILTGATGLVGSGVLDAMLKMKQVSKITILSRRPVRMADDAQDPRVQVILHKDFEKYDSALLSQIQDATGCVWALGISQSQVGKEEYTKITKDFPLRFAEAFQQARSTSPTTTTTTTDTPLKPFHFVYVSGEGATHSPGLLTPLFGRVKGETEIALGQFRQAQPQDTFRAVSVRPAFVDCAAHEAIKPYVPPVGILKSGVGAGLGLVVRSGWKSQWSPTEHLGRFLTEAAMGRWEGPGVDGPGVDGPGVEKGPGEYRIFGNVGFRRLAGLAK